MSSVSDSPSHILHLASHLEHTPRVILVTGGAGFIGCNYVSYMLATDPDVKIINLDLLTYAGSLDNLKDLPDESRHIFIKGDICDRELVDRLLREYEIDTIVHFAAESHVDNSISGPEVFVKTNVLGTFTLLEAARQHWMSGTSDAGCETTDGKANDDTTSDIGHLTSHDAPASFRFHHISTDEVYGTLGENDPAFTETTPYAPNSPYSASKAGSDHLARAYFHTYGMPVTTSNCSNNYGPHQHSEKLIPTIIRNCVNGSPIPVYGDGSNIRDWLYVKDHCSGIDAVIRRGAPGEVYNIGGLNEWNNINIVRCICTLMDELRPLDIPHKVNPPGDILLCHTTGTSSGHNSPDGEAREGAPGYRQLISFVTDRPGHDWRYAIDATKMGHELSWKPSETFESGIRKTVEWYLNLTQHNRNQTELNHREHREK